MQANQTPVIWTVIIATIILLVTGLIGYMAIPTAEEVAAKVDVPSATEVAGIVLANVNIPTAAEIAALVDVPESKDTRLSLRQELKADAISICNSEFDIDDVEDLFGDDDFVTLVREYIDDREYTNINLGIDDVDDRTITVDRVYKVEVEPDIGDDYKTRVYVTCVVTSDDGDLEADLSYSL